MHELDAALSISVVSAEVIGCSGLGWSCEKMHCSESPDHSGLDDVVHRLSRDVCGEWRGTRVYWTDHLAISECGGRFVLDKTPAKLRLIAVQDFKLVAASQCGGPVTLEELLENSGVYSGVVRWAA